LIVSSHESRYPHQAHAPCLHTRDHPGASHHAQSKRPHLRRWQHHHGAQDRHHRRARERFAARIAFFSTDYVFDGAAGPYSETEPRHAISVYGKSKVVAEEWLEQQAADALILRTTGVYDYLPGSKNFLMQMISLWSDGKETKIPADQYANPVWARELAKATLELLERGARGIYNVAGATQMKRTDFAAAIARVFGLKAALIVPVATKDLAQLAKRPLKGGLKCGKLEKELGWAPAGAVEVLESLKWLHQR